MEVVAACDGTHFGNDEEFASVLFALAPDSAEGLGERNPILDLRSELAFSVRDGNLAMVAVERAEVYLLHALDELGLDQQTRGVVAGVQVLHDGDMGIIQRYGQEFACSFAVGIR